MKDLYYEIGQRIKEVRQTNNITQQEMSNIMGVSVKHCSEIERGESTYSLQKMVYFCDRFGVSLDYLVRGITGPDPNAPVIPQIVVDIMSSDDEEKIKIFLEYLAVFNAMNSKV